MSSKNHLLLSALLCALGTALFCSSDLATGTGGSSQVGNPVIAGICVDARDGSAAKQSVLRLYSSPATAPASADSLIATTLSNAHGEYRFETIPKGRYSLSAELISRGDTLSARRFGLILADSSLFFTDTLRLPGAIQGSVKVQGGNHGGVFCFIPGSSSIAISDTNGAFRINNIPPGHYPLSFRNGRHNDTTLYTIEVIADSVTTLSPMVLTFAPHQNEKHVAGILVGEVGTVATLHAIIGSAGSAVRDTFPLSRQRNGERYSGFVFTRGSEAECSATIEAFDGSGRLIGTTVEPFENTTAIIAIPPFHARNSCPLLHARAESEVSINDTIHLHVSAIDSFGGTITSVEYRSGASQNFTSLTDTTVCIIAPNHADSAYRCIVRAFDNHGNSVYDTISTVVVADCPTLTVIQLDTLVSFGQPVRGTVMVNQRFGHFKVTLDAQDNGSFIELPQHDSLASFSFTTDAACSWKGYRLRVSDDDGNNVERFVKLDIRPRTIALDTVHASTREARLYFHPSHDEDFAAYQIYQDGDLIATISNRLDTMMVCDSNFAYNPRTWRVVQVDREEAASSFSPGIVATTLFSDSSVVISPSFTSDTLSVRALLDKAGLQNQSATEVIELDSDSAVIALTLTALPAHCTQLSPALGNLHRLQRLCISHSSLEALPDAIGKLASLRHFVLNDTRMQSLPDTLWSLPQLRTLSLANTPLHHISEKIGALRTLEDFEFLALDTTFSTTLPAVLWTMPQLTTLRISGIPLSTLLPAEVSLPQLIDLRLIHCGLDSLPSWVSVLRGLKILILTDNQLTALPQSIGMLSALSHLDISENKLSALPAQCAELYNLQSLLMAGNNLHTLPPLLTRLTNIKAIDVENNHLCTLDQAQQHWLSQRQRSWLGHQQCP